MPQTVTQGSASAFFVQGQGLDGNTAITLDSTSGDQAQYFPTHVQYLGSIRGTDMLSAELPADMPSGTYDVSVDNGAATDSLPDAITVEDAPFPLKATATYVHGRIQVVVQTGPGVMVGGFATTGMRQGYPVHLRPRRDKPGIWSAVFKMAAHGHGSAANGTIFITITAFKGTDSVTIIRGVTAQ